MLPISEFAITGLYFSGMVFFLSSLALLALYKFRWKNDLTSFSVWMLVWAASAFITSAIIGSRTEIFLVIGVNVILTLLFYPLVNKISVFGAFFLGSMWAPSFFVLLWLKDVVKAISISNGWITGMVIVLLGILISLLILINTAMLSWIVLVRYSCLYFKFPRLNKGLEQANQAKNYVPFVSIHLPCYNEPAAVVIETLNALSRLEYANYEVIVLDNNTKDSNLWKPLQDYCSSLGKNFRFYHYDHLDGAKAGALNACLKLASPQAEIISVIDSDYVSKKDFLKDMVGFFADPQVGFVQTCQDYKEWENNPFKQACYFEYETHFKLELTGQNEWDVNYTVGTMCLIRRQLLDQVGGWAEWCLTEDSEVAVRIHALGYKGFYINTSYGYGLIPDTFEGYKLQRFRWSAGPVQQFLKHYKLYLPWGNAGKLEPIQKFGEISHSLANFFTEALNFLINVPILLFCLWYATKGVSFKVPPAFILLIVISFFRGCIFNWITIRLINGNWKNYLLSSIAARSLVYVRNSAAYSALFASKLAWERTDKFKAESNIGRIVNSARPEIIGGIIYICLAGLLMPFVSFLVPDIIFLIWLGILNQTVSFWCAPLMACLSENGLRMSPQTVLNEPESA
ncbi:MAG: glycosyltransferase [Candidatus Protochlamydia sp.]|nr:glycosyltransferase [Candidatus Protochlamydia sp.]